MATVQQMQQALIKQGISASQLSGMSEEQLIKLCNEKLRASLIGNAQGKIGDGFDRQYKYDKEFTLPTGEKVMVAEVGTSVLKSGRKVQTFVDVAGNQYFQYRSADNKVLDEKYFRKQEKMGLGDKFQFMDGKLYKSDMLGNMTVAEKETQKMKSVNQQLVEQRIKKLPETDKNYRELMDEISEQEFNNLSFADKKKYLANNMWNALDKNDFSAWTESLGKFFSIHNEKIDKTVGITDLKKFIGELCDDSGLTNLVKKMCKTPLPTDVLTDLVIHQLYDEKAMDSAEIRVRMVKGVKDIAKDLVGAQGLEMAGIFGAIGKIASALPKVGKALEAGFVTVGGVDAASGAVNIAEGIATNNGELVSQGTGQAVMGGIMAVGGLRAGAKGRASAKAKAETAKDPAVETLSSKIDRSADVKRIKTEGIKGQYKDKNLKQSFDDVIAEIEAMPDIKEGKWDSQKEWGSIIVVDTGLPSKYDQIIFTKKVALKDGRTATYKLTKNIESGSAYKSVIFDEEGPTPTFTAYYHKANGKPESYNFSSKHGSQHFEYDGNGSLVDNSSDGFNSRYIEHHLSYSNYRQRNNGTVVRDKHLFDDDSRSTVIGTDGKVYKPYSYYGRNGKHITQSFFIDTKQILDANGNVIAEYGIETENYRVRFGKNEEPPAVVGVKIGDKHAYANLSKGGHIVLDNADVDPRTITLLDGTPIFDKFTVENGLYTATSKKITPESLGFKETPSMIDRAQNAKNNAVETLKNVPWKKVAKNGAKYAAKITGSVGIAGGFAALGLKNCHVVDGVDEGTYETNIVQEVNNVVDIDIEKEP